MLLSQLTEEQLTDEMICRLLFEGLDYTGGKAELILVLGSRKAREYRVPFAVALYNAGRSRRLLMSGGKRLARYEMRREYELMLEAAENLGIPRERILTEKRSQNTIENMEFSREIIARELPKCKKIILVTTAYHMRRALMLARKIMPEYEFIPAPVKKGSTTPDNWKQSEKGITAAHTECMKLKWCAEQGLIDDMEI